MVPEMDWKKQALIDNLNLSQNGYGCI